MSRTKFTCLFEQFSLYELTFDVELGPRFVSFKLESELDQSLSLVLSSFVLSCIGVQTPSIRPWLCAGVGCVCLRVC